jgi:hypothetical protein
MFTNPFRTKRLTEKEKQSIPYKGGETLVFKSNKSELDTIRITKISQREHPPNPGDMFWAKTTEVLRVHSDIDCKNCDAIIMYSVENFSSETSILYNIKINEKRYYLSTNFKNFTKLKPNSFKISGIELDDIIIITRTHEKSPNRLEKLYWSKSKGIVRIEINDNYYWELLN